MFLNELIYLRSEASIVSAFDWVFVCTNMDTRTLLVVITKDIKDFSTTDIHTERGLFADLTDQGGRGRRRIRHIENDVGHAFELQLVHSMRTVWTLQEISLRVLALQMPHTVRVSECQPQCIDNVSGHSSGPDVTVVSFVHAIQGLGSPLRR